MMKIGELAVNELIITLENGLKIGLHSEQGVTIYSDVNPFTKEEREYLKRLHEVLFPSWIT